MRAEGWAEEGAWFLVACDHGRMVACAREEADVDAATNEVTSLYCCTRARVQTRDTGAVAAAGKRSDMKTLTYQKHHLSGMTVE